MATSLALNTTEILEHILTFLPQQDLLRVVLVNQQFKTVIDESPTLQKILFLKAEISDDGSLPRLNSMLFDTCEGAATRVLSGLSWYFVTRWFECVGQGWGHGWYTGRSSDLRGRKQVKPTADASKLAPSPFRLLFLRRKPLVTSFDDSNASCRRMFLTQPPVKRARVHIGAEMKIGMRAPVWIESEEGLTYEDVLAYVKEIERNLEEREYIEVKGCWVDVDQE